MYDDLLMLPMSHGVELFRYADNVVIVVTAHEKGLFEELVNPVLENINSWMV